jgi:cation:H+ antiporter
MLDPVLFNTFVLLISLLIVFRGADLVVYGITRYARKLGLSDLLIGLVVVALAASMPEIISSVTGLMLGKEDVLFGTMLGTNLVHLSLVLGVLALVGKKIKLEAGLLHNRIWVLGVVLLIPFALMLDGNLSRVDGLILIILYTLYLGWIWHRETSLHALKKRVLLKTIARDGLIFVLSLIAILLSGRWLVFSSLNLAALAGIPTYFISLTVLAFAGALPDFAVGLRSVFRGHQDVGVGDVLGSVTLELLLFFGLVGLLHPLTVSVPTVLPAMIALTCALAVVLWRVSKKSMTWKHGLVLVGIYVAFIAFEAGTLF